MRRRRCLGRAPVCAALALAVGTLLGGCGSSSSASRPKAHESATLAVARHHDQAAYRAALRHGGKVVPFRHGGSFSVVLAPRRRPATAIVTLHGYKSTAFEQFESWYPYAARRGWGLIAVQWRTGFTRTAFSYSPETIYAEVARRLEHDRIGRHRALLHGYSSGGIRTYGITALDSRSHRFFGVSIANAGAALSSFPLRSEIVGERLGAKPLAGSRWVLYCGGRDPHPTYTGCPVMRASAAFVTRYGGEVLRLIVDPHAGHAGFLEHAANVELALREFGTVLRGD